MQESTAVQIKGSQQKLKLQIFSLQEKYGNNVSTYVETNNFRNKVQYDKKPLVPLFSSHRNWQC